MENENFLHSWGESGKHDWDFLLTSKSPILRNPGILLSSTSPFLLDGDFSLTSPSLSDGTDTEDSWDNLSDFQKKLLLRMNAVTLSPVKQPFYRAVSPVKHSFYSTVSPVKHPFYHTESPVKHLFNLTESPVKHLFNLTESPVKHLFNLTESPVKHLFKCTESPVKHASSHIESPNPMKSPKPYHWSQDHDYCLPQTSSRWDTLKEMIMSEDETRRTSKRNAQMERKDQARKISNAVIQNSRLQRRETKNIKPRNSVETSPTQSESDESIYQPVRPKSKRVIKKTTAKERISHSEKERERRAKLNAYLSRLSHLVPNKYLRGERSSSAISKIKILEGAKAYIRELESQKRLYEMHYKRNISLKKRFNKCPSYLFK